MTTSSDARVPAGTVLRGKWNGRSYRLERMLGIGANGQVYMAVSGLRTYALKIGMQLEDLQAEANVLASLDRRERKRPPFLLDVDDAEWQGRVLPFYVMQYVPGVPVKTYLAEHGGAWYGVVGYRLLNRLAELHAAGWAFGDVKSDNILVTDYGRVSLVDYGGMTAMGRSVRQFTEVYDRGYWSAGSRTADPSYDVFSVAVLWIHALDGKRLAAHDQDAAAAEPAPARADGAGPQPCRAEEDGRLDGAGALRQVQGRPRGVRALARSHAGGGRRGRSREPRQGAGVDGGTVRRFAPVVRVRRRVLAASIEGELGEVRVEAQDDLAVRVAGSLKDTFGIGPGARIVAGVSGGPDSMAMLHLLQAAAVRDGSLVIAAHVNHGFRGTESDAEAALVRETAAAWGIPFELAEIDMPAYIEATGMNAQAASRERRYAFLRDVARRRGAKTIAVAHHADDQAETVLMRMLRGSGVTGLAGIPIRRAEEELELIRPLLRITKGELLAYNERNGVPYATDSSNVKTRYVRNAIRLEALPYLERYNPDLRAGLARLAELASADDEYMEAEARRALAAGARRSGEGWRLDARFVRGASPCFTTQND
ncbi:tRNA lysidine(34) synthetase TilS [Cohnella rhizosphaerae]|uniref:tRNA(Ile)-lysidine synthase n=1 Tax=Cohnella rhizosphaerae TaxID=1457232 RepID=A0A9X4KQT9_9BACL|nr:tRNA lysidine(34) synthetase TilS [Cohnella rhizosphaerae]MDG0808968.1 tRNA lysidine(34) synthetase TilS [Cohnella rhizosphaerae]